MKLQHFSRHTGTDMTDRNIVSGIVLQSLFRCIDKFSSSALGLGVFFTHFFSNEYILDQALEHRFCLHRNPSADVGLSEASNP